MVVNNSNSSSLIEFEFITFLIAYYKNFVNYLNKSNLIIETVFEFNFCLVEFELIFSDEEIFELKHFLIVNSEFRIFSQLNSE